ncbi:hypothetical protein PGB90_009799 [Kerria lacca]
MFTEEHLTKRMASALEFLTLYQQDPSIIQRIVTGDETWILHMLITTKQEFMECKHYDSPATKKFKETPSARKIMETFFLGPQRHYLYRIHAEGHH